MTYKIDTPVELYDRQYKEMIKVNKKLNTLRYVFYAMIYDLDKMLKNDLYHSDEYNKLYSRLKTLFDTDMKKSYKEYERLVNLVYKPI